MMVVEVRITDNVRSYFYATASRKRGGHYLVLNIHRIHLCQYLSGMYASHNIKDAIKALLIVLRLLFHH